MPTVSRMPCVDALKGIACLLIVLHHLADYGPMSDIAYPIMPGLIDLFYQYGRMAVQVFFVIAGFLLAKKFALNDTSPLADPLLAIGKRYMRLAPPYLVALFCAIVCAALARCWLVLDTIPAAPDFTQICAHIFLLQDLLGQQALSAGIWYVAIDLQLFSVAVLLLWLGRRIASHHPKYAFLGPLFIVLLCATSLFFFNLDKALDTTALYFFGSYGLGAAAYWATCRPHSMRWLVALSTTVVVALLIDFRGRILVAGCVMLALGMARHSGALERWQMPHFLNYLGRISYSIFLIHFPLCLLVNTAFFHFFPQQPVANALGILIAFCLSIAGGALLFEGVENRRWTGRQLPTANALPGRLMSLPVASRSQVERLV